MADETKPTPGEHTDGDRTPPDMVTGEEVLHTAGQLDLILGRAVDRLDTEVSPEAAACFQSARDEVARVFRDLLEGGTPPPAEQATHQADSTSALELPGPQLIYLAAVVRSATGEHLARIEDAADFEIDLDASRALRHAREGKDFAAEIFQAELGVELHTTTIDLRGNVPDQVARQLAAWAEHLLALAAKVCVIEPERLLLEPRAHIIQNLVTGETTEGGPFYDLAYDDLAELHLATKQAHKIVTSPLSEWPEQESQFASLILDAIRQAKGDD